MSTVSVCQQRPPSALPAAPRFENRRCDPAKTEGEKKTDSPTHLKVANRSGLVVEGSPARAEAQRGEREKGGDYALGCRGCQPRINSRSMGRSALPMGAWGRSPSTSGSRSQVCRPAPEGQRPSHRAAAPIPQGGDKKKDASIAGSALLLWETGN